MNMPALPSDAKADDSAMVTALAASRIFKDAPEALVMQAIDLWRRAAPWAGCRLAKAETTPAEALRKLVAALVFDSADGGLVAAGRRNAHLLPGLASRQLLFSIEGRDIDVRITPLEGGARWAVTGQVLGPDGAGSAELRHLAHSAHVADGYRQGQPPANPVPWSDLAEFEFDPVPAGDYCLFLTAVDWSAEILLSVSACSSNAQGLAMTQRALD